MNFHNRYMRILDDVMRLGEEVEVGEWQSKDVRDKPEMISRELRHFSFHYNLPDDGTQWNRLLQQDIKPNLPWAEDHFQERISGQPLNPPPSEAWWPFKVEGNAAHKVDDQFHHTYPERIWPKFASTGETRPNGRQVFVPHNGIRYEYGDLNDVIDQLTRNPLTRQAYLPIWFPEDTGACGTEGQRVPCTLGYQFIIRDGRAEIVYHIRSCDMLRHFPDDVYMACRLLQWVVGKLRDRSVNVTAHSLHMHITSFHIFRGDYERVRYMLKDWYDQEEEVYGAGV